MMQAMDVLQHRVRLAARALARAGLVTAFGHCSERIDERSFLVSAARPLGLIKAGDRGTIVPLDGDLPDGVLGEVRVHREIYRCRREVNGICRTASPHVLALSAMHASPSARHGFGAYFYPFVPFWPGTALVRDDLTAARVAASMGESAAIVLGVNGAVIAAETLERSLTLAWFLEDSARVELAVRAAGGAGNVTFETAAEAQARATWDGRIAERAWEYLTDGLDD
jgi:HCOMODA/2-hydroxy-3-carboxy-muconic semialdehyde decarboxylase